MGERKLTGKEILLVEACLLKIDQEMRRLYWNRNQKELNSPFENTGEEYSDGTFTVSAYDWGDDPDGKPNFTYGGLKVWWYKRMGRGTCGRMETGVRMDAFLGDMLSDCFRSMGREFGERN